MEAKVISATCAKVRKINTPMEFTIKTSTAVTRVALFNESGAGLASTSSYVDENGDLLFSSRVDTRDMAQAQEFVDENSILFSLAFGPILIEDGERCEPKNYDLGEVNSFSPRAALCQMGKRHYLIVTANQEGSHSGAITIHQLAERLVETGCEKAYTLDGGQTAAIALGGELVNRVLYGQQRSISDIIYFATSVGG